MGFKINYRKRVAIQFGLSEEETNELLKRLHGHLKRHGVSHEEIAKSFFILREILERKEKQRIRQNVPQLGFKNKGIEKYKIEIVKLYEQGLSAEKIHHTLKLKKEAPSLSTIKRYIKAFKEWKGTNNG